MNREFSHRCICSLALLVGVLLAGCEQAEITRYKIVGKVSLDGQPLADGEVLFIPADGIGPSDACPIVNGEFEGQVAPGAKRVQVNSTKDTGKVAPDGLPDYRNIIPRQYNVESTLTAEISKGDDSPLVFDLKSDGK